MSLASQYAAVARRNRLLQAVTEGKEETTLVTNLARHHVDMLLKAAPMAAVDGLISFSTYLSGAGRQYELDKAIYRRVKEIMEKPDMGFFLVYVDAPISGCPTLPPGRCIHTFFSKKERNKFAEQARAANRLATVIV